MGLPPKVEPWLPGVKSEAAVPKAIMAPSGSPPPNPFAKVITSGRIPECSYPNHSPVRPIPVCTASIASNAPASSQIFRAS